MLVEVKSIKASVGSQKCLQCTHYWLNVGDCTGSCDDVAKRCEDFVRFEENSEISSPKT
jgi:hypothetical protein